MEKILLFQVPQGEAEQVNEIASNMRIKVETVPLTEYKRTLGSIAKEFGSAALPSEELENKVSEAAAPKGSMMVFCDVSEKHLNKILFEMRAKKITIMYKSVMTEINKSWNILKMYGEMERERIAYLFSQAKK